MTAAGIGNVLAIDLLSGEKYGTSETIRTAWGTRQGMRCIPYPDTVGAR